jgi:hypothetical protein
MEKVEVVIEQLAEAIERDDPVTGKRAALALAAIVFRDLGRVADALEHIARSTPARP